MTDSPMPLDGAIVRFLLRVVDRFEGMVADPDALLANLKAVGLDDGAVTQFQSFLIARASDISKLSTDLPKLLAVVDSSSPDLLSLVTPVKDLWTVVTALVKDAPKLTAPELPQAPSRPNGDVLGQLVTTAVDGALREASTAVWASLAATGFVGPGTSLLSAVSEAVHHPLAYVWESFQALRRESTLSIAGVLTGPRVIS